MNYKYRAHNALYHLLVCGYNILIRCVFARFDRVDMYYYDGVDGPTVRPAFVKSSSRSSFLTSFLYSFSLSAFGDIYENEK